MLDLTVSYEMCKNVDRVEVYDCACSRIHSWAHAVGKLLTKVMNISARVHQWEALNACCFPGVLIIQTCHYSLFSSSYLLIKTQFMRTAWTLVWLQISLESIAVTHCSAVCVILAGCRGQGIFLSICHCMQNSTLKWVTWLLIWKCCLCSAKQPCCSSCRGSLVLRWAVCNNLCTSNVFVFIRFDLKAVFLGTTRTQAYRPMNV